MRSKIWTILFIYILFFINNCNSFTQRFALQIKEFENPQIKSFSLRIDNSAPSLKNEIEYNIASTFKKEFENNNLSLDIREENLSSNIVINIILSIDKNHQKTLDVKYLGGGRKSVTSINVPFINAEMQVLDVEKNKPILQIREIFSGNHTLSETGQYYVEKAEALASRIAYFYSSIVVNFYREPSSLTGSWKNMEDSKIRFQFKSDNIETLAKYESPIYKNWQNKEIKVTTIYNLNSNPEKRGFIHIYEAVRNSKTFYLEEKTEKEYSYPCKLYVFGNMIFVHIKNSENNGKVIDPVYLIKE